MTARKFKNDTTDSSDDTTKHPSPLTFNDLTRQIHAWLLVNALWHLRHDQRGGALIVGRREWRLHPSAVRLHLAFRRRFGTPPGDEVGR